MTADENYINEIKILLKTISPYPWTYSRAASGEWWILAVDETDHDYRNSYEPIFESSGTLETFRFDAKFIAESPTIIENLLALLESRTKDTK